MQKSHGELDRSVGRGGAGGGRARAREDGQQECAMALLRHGKDACLCCDEKWVWCSFRCRHHVSLSTLPATYTARVHISFSALLSSCGLANDPLQV
eukprot:768781-Hanusia_phi.AAC.20